MVYQNVLAMLANCQLEATSSLNVHLVLDAKQALAAALLVIGWNKLAVQ
jgi:hypothetical protein